MMTTMMTTMMLMTTMTMMMMIWFQMMVMMVMMMMMMHGGRVSTLNLGFGPKGNQESCDAVCLLAQYHFRFVLRLCFLVLT